MFVTSDHIRGVIATVLAVLVMSGRARGDSFSFAHTCDNVWQTCCGGDVTKFNNWNRTSPAPVCPVQPGGADDVTITLDCVVGPSPLPGAVAGTIDQSGSTFTISGNLAIGQSAVFNGPVIWSAGEVARSGGAAGQFALCNGGLTISNAGPITLSGFGGFRLINAGAGLWNGAGDWTIGMIPGGTAPSFLENTSGATFTVQTNARILDTAFGVGVIENAGTLIKSGAAGLSEWAVNLSNTGLVHVQTGELRLKRAGLIAGNWLVEPGAQLSFAGNFFTLDPGVTIQGRAVVMQSGTNPGIQVNQDVTINDLTIADDGRLGGTGVLRINGTLTNEGGDPSVYIVINPSGKLETSGVAPFFGKLDVKGLVHIPAGANMGCFNQILTVLNGGEVRIDNGGLLQQSGLLTQPIENHGTIRKTTGSGTGTIFSAFNWLLNHRPDGLIVVEGGTLDCLSRFESEGEVNIAAGATFRQGAWATYYPGSRFTGGGTYLLNSTNTFIQAGYELPVANMIIEGTIGGGQGVSGPGNLRVKQSLELRGGYCRSGTTTVETDAVVKVVGPNFTETSNWQHHGRTVVTAGGMNYDTVYQNHVGAQVEVKGDISFGGRFGNGVFNNQGSYVKSAGTGDSTMTGTVNNSGTFEVQSGRVVTNNYNQSAGVTRLAGGGISVSFGLMSLSGGLLTGTGTITGATSNPGGTIAPGSSTGTLTVTSNFSQGAGGTLEIELGGLTPGTKHDRVVVGGSATLGGTLRLIPYDGFAPQVGQQFTIMTRASGSGAFSQVVGVGGGQYNVTYNPTSVVVTVVTAPCGGTSPCDTNCNGTVNQFDIQSFVTTLAGGSAGCGPCAADTNLNGTVNSFDIQAFVECLIQ